MNQSIKSPKNKYYARVCFDKPRMGIGSVVSFTSNDVAELKALLKSYAPGHVTIHENKAEYPKFDWCQLEMYNI